jgi:3-methyladenine DNA glycosylase/8-oxoguanine DNA glycosylase
VPHRLVPVDAPLSLRATLGPATLTWGVFLPDGWWRPMRTPDGPATLHVRRAPTGVVGTAWGDGAGWILDRLPGWIGLDDEPGGFAPRHPAVAELHRRNRGARFCRTGLMFDALAYAVLGQKVTGKESRNGLRGLARRFSDPAPGPVDGLRLPPDPERVAAAPYHEFHDLGIEKRRTDTLRRLAGDVRRIEQLAEVPPAEARAALERYPGVGPWTSAETVVVTHGDPDAVSVGDFHLKHYVCWHLAGEARGSDERMLELLEPFRPHRARVARLLEQAGPYPRYGPRRPVRSFAGY